MHSHDLACFILVLAISNGSELFAQRALWALGATVELDRGWAPVRQCLDAGESCARA